MCTEEPPRSDRVRQAAEGGKEVRTEENSEAKQEATRRLMDGLGWRSYEY